MYTWRGTANTVTAPPLPPEGFPCCHDQLIANTGATADLVANGASHMMTKYPNGLVITMDDFNSCRLDCIMPSFHQYMDIPTRKSNTLDLMLWEHFWCVDSPCTTTTWQLQSQFCFPATTLHTGTENIKPHIHCTTLWLEDAITQLKGSLGCTDFHIFQGDLDTFNTCLPSPHSITSPNNPE